MIAEAIEKIVRISSPRIEHINGKTYADRKMEMVDDGKNHISQINLHGLIGLVKMVKKEALAYGHIFVSIEDPIHVKVFTMLDDDGDREYLYGVEAQVTGFRSGYRKYEEFVIELRSRFVQNEGSQYLLNLLSRMDITEKTSSEDNGVTQSVTVRQGVALKDTEAVKPIVTLTPYRTFFEVEQPESDFLVRVDREGSIGLFEADGGMWQQAAKRFVSEWLQEALEEETESGQVSVLW